jgi:hypothetical protein
MLSSV